MYGHWAVKLCSKCRSNEILHSSYLQGLMAKTAIFGRVRRIASEEEVVLHLTITKCIPILQYGLEACPLRKTDLNSSEVG